MLGSIFLLCDVSFAAKKPHNQDVVQLTEALTAALKEVANGRITDTQIIMVHVLLLLLFLFLFRMYLLSFTSSSFR